MTEVNNKKNIFGIICFKESIDDNEMSAFASVIKSIFQNDLYTHITEENIKALFEGGIIAQVLLATHKALSIMAVDARISNEEDFCFKTKSVVDKKQARDFINNEARDKSTLVVKLIPMNDLSFEDRFIVDECEVTCF
jgi:hypothetical protein